MLSQEFTGAGELSINSNSNLGQPATEFLGIFFGSKIIRYIISCQIRHLGCSSVIQFRIFLLYVLIKYFATYTKRKKEIEISAIVPLGAELSTYDRNMPLTTDVIEMSTEINRVLLNPVPNIMAVILGITVNEEISKIPTNLMDAITVRLARTMKK